MCGIHCILDKQQHESAAPLERMMQESAYRGPDAANIQRINQSDHTVWLGSQRLSISDPHPRANQPFASSDGRYVLLYNGEIYNYYELRNQLLQEGVSFTTQSDTEVLLYWLMRRGTLGLNELNGMFALIYYDQQEATLWAARDRHGMKPLYYAETERYLIVSSEAKSIVASGLIVGSLRTEAIDPYLCFRYSPKGQTFYQEIAQLEEGQLRTAKGRQESETRSYLPAYWVSDEGRWRSEQSEQQIVQTVEHLLTEAAIRHVATDVPTGLFLSGGVDSTLLLALLQQEKMPLPPAFAIAHAASDASFGTRDAHFARQAAEQYGAHYEEVTVTADLLEETFDHFIRRTDQPVGDSGAFTTYLLSQVAGQRVKVVLSGAGADELFGGYHRHWAYYQYLYRYPLLVRFLPLARTMGAWLPTGTAHPFRQAFRLLKKLATNLTDDPTETFAHFISFTTLCQLGQSHDSLHHTERHHHQSDNFVEEYMGYALQHDQQHYLVSDVLAVSDTMSMAHGIEMRMPYLDKELVQYVNSLPAALRLKHGRKWLLRRILDAKGGKVYAQRRKEGFGLPFGSWLRDPNMPLVRQYLEDASCAVYRYVPHGRIMHLLEQHRRGRHDYGLELWSVLTLTAWVEAHFSGG